jgi:hypothetical protein
MSGCVACGAALPVRPFVWMGSRFCDMRCAHVSGDRRCCYIFDCGCSKYAKNKRELHELRRELHRVRQHMGVMDQLIEEHDLLDELDDRLARHPGTGGFPPGEDSELDERDDPEVLLREARAQLEDQSNLLEVAQHMVEAQRLRSEDDDMRKQMEDMRKQLESMSVGTALDSLD